MHVESAAQVSARTFLFIMIWSWTNTHHGIPEPASFTGREIQQWTGLSARVCKQRVLLKGKRGERVEGRTIFLCNTDMLILQNFTGTVMSVARRKKPKYAHKWHHNANKASQRERKLFSKADIWSVQLLSFHQMVLKQPEGSIWQCFIVLWSKGVPSLVCPGVGCFSPKSPLCAAPASEPRPLSQAGLSLLCSWHSTQTSHKSLSQRLLKGNPT